MNKTNYAQRALADALKWVPTLMCSGAIGWGSRRTIPNVLRSPIYTCFSKALGVKLEEVELPLLDYPTFGDFFARRLRAEARIFEESDFCSPCDGELADRGEVDSIISAKGAGFTLPALLASDEAAARLEGGTYATVYLSPKDYHRVHSPCGGRLVRCRYIPGRLLPVRPSLIKAVDDIFSNNERVVFEIESDQGFTAVVMVGAMGVGNISLSHSADESRRLRSYQEIRDLPCGPSSDLRAGDELGAFFLGSTVIVCGQQEGFRLSEDLEVGQALRAGERIGSYPGASKASAESVDPRRGK